MRAVIYARVSGEDRGSLQTQIDMGRAYAAQHGYSIAAEFSEDWMSGLFDDRTTQISLGLVRVWRDDKYINNSSDTPKRIRLSATLTI